ncbi:MAG: Flp pilus assembly protein CpaB [Burkholderiales bacterium]|nr:MAG: Flp pilus assembly protein CpaB [Burkholderiales bacterium]
MPNSRALLMIVIAVLAGIAAVILAARWLGEQGSLATNRIAVASVDISLGQAIAQETIRLIEWPSGSVPAGAFATVEGLEGRVAKTAILRDEPVLESKLAPVGTKGGLSAVIAEGKRAITVRVNDVVGVAGFALPGNYVDVLVNTEDDRATQALGRRETVSKIVLEKILVLAVAQEASRDDTKPRVVNAVTLEVSPDEAEKLDLARSVGSLSLVLRNQIDASPVVSEGATKDDLLGPLPPLAVAPPPPKPVIAEKPAPKPRVVTIVRRVQAPEPEPNCVEAFVGTERRVECF